MTEKAETPVCGHGESNTTFHFPIETRLDIEGGLQGSRERVWAGPRFSAARGSSHSIFHGLNLDSPWLCKPSIVYLLEPSMSGLDSEAVIFSDGMNYEGKASNTEEGWTISLARDICHISFGNGKSGLYAGLPRTSFQCRLVISY